MAVEKVINISVNTTKATKGIKNLDSSIKDVDNRLN